LIFRNKVEVSCSILIKSPGCKADALNASLNLLGKQAQKFNRLQANTWQGYNVVKSLSLKVNAHQLGYK
jgi:hypothetical protein